MLLVSDAAGSSGQMSARSSHISTYSRARSFLTTFGGTAAEGVYGTALWSDRHSRAPSPVSDCCERSPSAAAAKTSRPAEELALGVNVGTPDSRAGSHRSPESVERCPATAKN